MKIKTAFTLSLAVNAILLAAVAYITFNTEPLHNSPIIIINRSATPESMTSTTAAEPNLAGVPK